MSETASALGGVPAVILAGGQGTRLQAVLPGAQKVVAAVGERPFLAYVLEALAAAGLREAILCTGYHAEQVMAQFGAAYGPLRLTYSHEPEPLGTAGAVRQALDHTTAETVLVLNGDSFCEADLGAFWAWHRARRAPGSLALTHVPDTTRYGRVRATPEGVVLGFEEKGGAGGPGWINAGLYLLTRQLVAQTPRGRAVSIEREMFPAWVGQGLCAWPGGGRFIDIGTPASYRAAAAFFAPAAAPKR
ncbi:MAG: nucleotidyltransferase family protein [Anaerolineales bacterium]|nr:nucleotidyltransferase family protein [Anaerolineales bacterium]